jgi:hypothetical protein
MTKLAQGLRGHDIGFLRIVAQLWGVEFDAPDARTGIAQLCTALLDPQNVAEMVHSLPGTARDALRELLENEGRLPWTGFVRRHGDVREMGSGRRDRDRPFEAPQASISEVLWYRAMVSRAFFDTPTGALEFAYIPDDLSELMPPVEYSHTRLPPGRPASPGERKTFLSATDVILDDACTLLAGLRSGLRVDELDSFLHCGKRTPYPITTAALTGLLDEAGLLDGKGAPLPEPTRVFLEAERGEALVTLVQAWLRSTKFNELRELPGIVLEGDWHNDPLTTRRTVLELIAPIPGGQGVIGAAGSAWWSTSAFLSAVYQHSPDIQRQAGEYDAWYIREAGSGDSLLGFEHWDQVDGALLRFILGGPLHWLGILDLSVELVDPPELPLKFTAFRFSNQSGDLLDQIPARGLTEEKANLLARSDGRLVAPAGVPRVARYQAARFCEWEEMKEGEYRYRITPASLERAQQAGLKVDHLLVLLNRHAKAVPPSLAQALKSWDEKGSLARLEHPVVLRLKDPELLRALRESKARRYLGDPLGPTAVIVKPGAWDKVVQALAGMGYLVDVEDRLREKRD